MTRFARLLLMLAASLAVSSSAHATTQDITLTATIQGFCTISDSDTPAAITHDLSIDATGRVSTTPIRVSVPFFCNKTAKLEVASVNRGLAGPAARAGYDNKIHYVVTTSGVFPTISYDSKFNAPDLPGGGSSYVSESSGPASGTLGVTITPAANVSPLVSGTYTDTVRLIITPVQ